MDAFSIGRKCMCVMGFRFELVTCEINILMYTIEKLKYKRR